MMLNDSASLRKDNAMPFNKGSVPVGGKQAPMPGPNSAAYKKIIAGKSATTKGGARGATGKGGRKRAKNAAAYSSLKSRQMLVDRVKRDIWASVLQINEAIINLALAGNFNAAKALFDFAGVYSLPDPDDENGNDEAAPAARAEQASSTAASDPIDAFFRSIGVRPSCAEPEPGTAEAGL